MKCRSHGVEKVWTHDFSRPAGGRFVCPECRREANRRFVARGGTKTPEARARAVVYASHYEKSYRPELRAKIIDARGGACEMCGTDDPRILEIDHVEGGGNQERKKGPGVTYLRRILADIDSGRFRVLCRNCNWIAHLDRREQAS